MAAPPLRKSRWDSQRQLMRLRRMESMKVVEAERQRKPETRSFRAIGGLEYLGPDIFFESEGNTNDFNVTERL